IGGATRLTANGTGGLSLTTTGGSGFGGALSVGTQGGSATLTGPLTVFARGTGGNGITGGFGEGGSLFIGSGAGNVVLSSAATADASGTGGAGQLGGQGGNGTGGDIVIFADAGAGSVAMPSFDGHADGTGGAGGANDAAG